MTRCIVWLCAALFLICVLPTLVSCAPQKPPVAAKQGLNVLLDQTEKLLFQGRDLFAPEELKELQEAVVAARSLLNAGDESGCHTKLWNAVEVVEGAVVALQSAGVKVPEEINGTLTLVKLGLYALEQS